MTDSAILIYASFIILAYSVGVGLGAVVFYALGYDAGVYYEREGRNASRTGLLEAHQAARGRRLPRSRVGDPESRGAGHRRFDPSVRPRWDGAGISPFQGGSEDQAEYAEQATVGAPSQVREFRIRNGRGVLLGRFRAIGNECYQEIEEDLA